MSYDDDCDASGAMDDDKEDSSSSEFEIENAALNKQKGKIAVLAVEPKKENKGKKGKLMHLVFEFHVHDLLLLTKSLMTVSCSTKQSMDKNEEKFLEEVSDNLMSFHAFIIMIAGQGLCE